MLKLRWTSSVGIWSPIDLAWRLIATALRSSMVTNPPTRPTSFLGQALCSQGRLAPSSRGRSRYYLTKPRPHRHRSLPRRLSSLDRPLRVLVTTPLDQYHHDSLAAQRRCGRLEAPSLSNQASALLALIRPGSTLRSATAAAPTRSRGLLPGHSRTGRRARHETETVQARYTRCPVAPIPTTPCPAQREGAIRASLPE